VARMARQDGAGRHFAQAIAAGEAQGIVDEEGAAEDQNLADDERAAGEMWAQARGLRLGQLSELLTGFPSRLPGGNERRRALAMSVPTSNFGPGPAFRLRYPMRSRHTNPRAVRRQGSNSGKHRRGIALCEWISAISRTTARCQSNGPGLTASTASVPIASQPPFRAGAQHAGSLELAPRAIKICGTML
jgi:hypothetical protein